MAPRCGGQAVPGIDRGSHRGPTIVGASDPREPTSGSGGRAAGRGYSDDVDELGRPVQRAWQDLLILAAVLSEVVLTVLFDSGSGGLWRGGLMALLAGALLWRHQHWRWLLPVVLAVNALTASLSILVIAVSYYATCIQRRLRTLLVGRSEERRVGKHRNARTPERRDGGRP